MAGNRKPIEVRNHRITTKRSVEFENAPEISMGNTLVQPYYLEQINTSRIESDGTHDPVREVVKLTGWRIRKDGTPGEITKTAEYVLEPQSDYDNRPILFDWAKALLKSQP